MFTYAWQIFNVVILLAIAVAIILVVRKFLRKDKK